VSETSEFDDEPQARRGWRTALILLLTLALLAGIGYAGYKMLRQPAKVALPACTGGTVVTPPAIPPDKITVDVLNGTGVGGLAASTASGLRARGYHVRKVGNAQSNPGDTVVFFGPGGQSAAYVLGSEFTGVHLVETSHLAGTPASPAGTGTLSGHHVVVVLGPGAALNPTLPSSAAPASPTCKPA
jgi:LytR cell envelope-related transcriptional attenuator